MLYRAFQGGDTAAARLASLWIDYNSIVQERRTLTKRGDQYCTRTCRSSGTVGYNEVQYNNTVSSQCRREKMMMLILCHCVII